MMMCGYDDVWFGQINGECRILPRIEGEVAACSDHDLTLPHCSSHSAKPLVFACMTSATQTDIRCFLLPFPPHLYVLRLFSR